MCRAGLRPGRCGSGAGGAVPHLGVSVPLPRAGAFPRRPLPGAVAGPQQAGGSSRVFNYTPSLCSLHFSAPFAVRHTWN